jgi:hypothetical protein
MNKAAESSSTVKCLIDPQLCGRIWQLVFDLESGNTNEALLNQCQIDPRGYCILFDAELQTTTPIGPYVPPRAKTPPPPLVVSFKFNQREGGAETVLQKEFLPKAKWAYLMEFVESLPSDINPDNLHLASSGCDLNARNKGDKETYINTILEAGAVVTLFDYKKVSLVICYLLFVIIIFCENFVTFIF